MGCGSDKELDEFKIAIDDFCNKVVEIDASMNGIDPTVETASQELLENLDLLNVTFQDLAGLKVPKEFSYIEDLADQASEYMGMAVEHYHMAYETVYDAATADIASQYYERAYKRVRYIITFLNGEVPDDENVKLIEE